MAGALISFGSARKFCLTHSFAKLVSNFGIAFELVKVSTYTLNLKYRKANSLLLRFADSLNTPSPRAKAFAS